ncbi:hypothetical protein [Pseudomonas monteilii]|uniref:Phage gp6-like head-tail connector protein n=1 Tax=Pseudomonas monteilii TaxID=76759 RepID=A0A2N1IMB6_9PSED|nr:hypothetical protein [Pseudomonas monteilii]PKI19404.1 hypothetical protein CXB65_23240 [Pseudomonas monteilii]RPD91915.1 hypothetical protein EGN69_15735 [Pseudomonas monteilii]
MARRIAYTGPPVLTLEQVAFQCRAEPEDLQPELIHLVVIPGVTAQAESKTGAAIREAIYEEEWPAAYPSGHSLDIGQVVAVESVVVLGEGGEVTTYAGQVELSQGGKESYLLFPGGRPAGRLRIRYRAGVDLEAYPGVLSWLLMAAETAFTHRGLLVAGQSLAEVPSSFVDHLLADVTVPPRF